MKQTVLMRKIRNYRKLQEQHAPAFLSWSMRALELEYIPESNDDFEPWLASFRIRASKKSRSIQATILRRVRGTPKRFFDEEDGDAV